MNRRLLKATLSGAVAATMTLALAGVAMAVSGGPYSSPSQDCPWYGSAWNAANGQTYPGCHNIAVTVESGGTTNGNPDNGYNDSAHPGNGGATNTQWAAFGVNQAPNDPKAQGTPGLLSVGLPGQSTSPHSGCLSVNTDGTNGGPQNSPQAGPYQQSNSYDSCGNNAKGLGFALTYDYYSVICPLLAPATGTSICENGATSGGSGQNSFTPDTGSSQTVTDILTKGLIVYLGMDDNFDNGEHDGEGPGTSSLTGGSINGPSDGGAIALFFTPQNATNAPSGSNPEGLVNLSTGACADGNCLDATTQQETVYYGCGANTGNNQSVNKNKCTSSQRNAYDYSGKQWDPYNCSSGGGPGQRPEPDSKQVCNDPSQGNTEGGLDYWRTHEAQQVNAEPGVQFYEDPDAQGSPAAPIYPNPALYAGTCGVYAGGGGLSSAGGSPVDQSFALPPGTPETNSAGQVAINSGLC